MKTVILKLDHANSLQPSNEGLKIKKIVSSISPVNFIKLLKIADNEVNPRNATENKVVKSIHETLDKSPELFCFKTKGILIATESCEHLDRNRIKISLDNLDYEGIMDGGHNTFAIATFIIEKLFNKNLKSWKQMKDFWDENYDEILEKFEARKTEFKFSIPIEIISPNNEDGSVEEFYDYIPEICSARNNNVQLKETAKGNKVGYYDHLKELLDEDFDIIWKTGDAGKIKSEDVISLASLSLIFLQENNLLPTGIKSLNKISIYSQKNKCIDFFGEVMSHPDVCEEINGRYILKDNAVKSALALVKNILPFFDKLYIEFPNLYHSAAPGKFGRISSVEIKQSRVPFNSTNEMPQYQYPYGFFYPLICGITRLMKYDPIQNEVSWKLNPINLDLNTLDLTLYVDVIRMVNYDPQKIGKGAAFYSASEDIFHKVAE